MKKQTILFLMLAIMFGATSAQGQRTRSISGLVKNLFTNENINNVKVYLLQKDSTAIDSMNTGSGYFRMPWEKPGEYLLRFEHEDFETAYHPITVKFYRRAPNTDLGFFYMRKKYELKEQVMDEIVVKATKVKFYMNGDTVVYDASAFRLAEGSMLDKLIEKLPGVEIKDDGRIFAKGKFVTSLLLNGEEFFGNNSKVLLENLPAMTVDKVKVYNKKDKFNEAMQLKADEGNLVMDVRLKKEYSTGYVGNMEGGYGTDNRYMGRLFASRFTPFSRISVLANVNNLNDERTPGANSNWTPGNNTNGLQERQIAGINHFLTDNKTYKSSTNVQVTHLHADNRQRTSGENFLSEGNTFKESSSNSRNDSWQMNASHALEINRLQEKGKLQLTTNTSFSYNKNKTNGTSTGANFSVNPENLGNVMDSLFLEGNNFDFYKYLLMRGYADYIYKGDHMNAKFNGVFSKQIAHTYDFLRIFLDASWNKADYDIFQRIYYNYPNNQIATTDYRNMYRDTPQKSYNYSARAEYRFYLPTRTQSLDLTPYYQYGQSFNSGSERIYQLGEYGAWGFPNGHDIGIIPSTEDSLYQVLDVQNSYNQGRHDFKHKPGVRLAWDNFNTEKKHKWSVYIEPPVRIEHYAMDYQRNKLDTTITRNVVFFEPYVKLTHKTKDKRDDLSFIYRTYSFAPDLNSLVSVVDDKDPMNTIYGNPDLKNTTIHDVYLTYSNFLKGQRTVSANLTYSYSKNAVIMGYSYDRNTTKKISRPENISGRWNTQMSLGFSSPVDKQKKITLYTNTNATYVNSVDLFGEDQTYRVMKYKVKSLYLTENLRAEMRYDKWSVGLKGVATWTHSDSERKDFETVNVVDFNYGMTGRVELPWGMEINTDLTMFSRRGYTSADMNTNELVWNMRIAKKMMDGNLSVMLDGFDLLGQLSSLRNVITAEGRTETWNNVIPRYALLHVVYRFNVNKKK